MCFVGEIVTCYVGEKLPTSVAIRRTDKAYLMRLGPNCYVDSRYSPLSLARYINDCRTPSGHNVKFLKSKLEGCAWVIASRNIHRGEELFVDYGRWYWVTIKPIKLSYFRLEQLKESLKCEVMRASEV